MILIILTIRKISYDPFAQLDSINSAKLYELYKKGKGPLVGNKTRHGIPAKEVFASRSREIGKAQPLTNNTTNADSKQSSDKLLAGFSSAFVASSLLAVLGHTTHILDVFGDHIKNIVKYLLDFVSITLGSITTAGFLADEDEEKVDLGSQKLI